MKLRDFLDLVVIRTKVISLSSFFLGTLFAAWAEGVFSPLRGGLMLAATLAVDMGTTAWNSYFDYLRNTDHPGFNREREKVLVHRGLSPASAFFASLALFSAAIPLGLVMALLSGPWVILAGALSMAVGFLYNGGPLPLSRTPLGEIFAGGFLGTGLFLISWGVQVVPAGIFSWAAFGRAAAVSLPSLILIASILTVNNTCDIQGDRRSGRRTLSILLGVKRGERLVYLQGVLALIILAALGVRGFSPPGALVSALLTAPLAGREYRKMHRRGFSHQSKGENMGGILRIFSLYTGLQIGVYLLALLF